MKRKGSPEFLRLMAKLKKIERDLYKINHPAAKKVPRLPRLISPRQHGLMTTRAFNNLGKVLDNKLSNAGMKLKFNSYAPEEKAKRKRLRKLANIVKLEHEFTGEEDWGI